jgi:hypothetical protein
MQGQTQATRRTPLSRALTGHVAPLNRQRCVRRFHPGKRVQPHDSTKGYPSIRKKLWGGALWSRPTSLEAVAVRLSRLCGNTSNSRKRRTKLSIGRLRRPRYPSSAEGPGLTRIPINNPATTDRTSIAVPDIGR